MLTASSAAVTVSSAVARILLITCCGKLIMANVNRVEANELQEKQTIQDRSIDFNSTVIENECTKFGGEVHFDRCFFVSEANDLRDYEHAMDACIAKQGELAMFPDDPGAGIDLVDVRDTGDPRYWVGGRDKDSEGGWQWENGEPIRWPAGKYPWGNGEPNNVGHEKCLDILTHGDHHGYNDEYCDHKHPYICELGCSFGGTIYPPGSFIHEACTQLQCDGATGQFKIIGYDDHCPSCYVKGDPHISTFDKKYYNYQKCGNYSITQIGSSFIPTYAVFGSFETCTYFDNTVTCLEQITFKNDNQTFITIGIDHKNMTWIQVNNKYFNMTELTRSPKLIKVDNEYPVLAWMYDSKCVQLQGTSGIMVIFCNNGYGNAGFFYVWASPDIANGLRGLCGTADGNQNNDFTKRSTDQTSSAESFGLSWIADSDGERCANRSANRRKKTENTCERNTSLPIIFRSQCEDAVLNDNFAAETNESQILIDSCIYDLCGAIDAKEGLEQIHHQMTIHTYIKNNTVGHCEHKRSHKCKTHNGKCILNTETCDGTIIERGCHGRKCQCCAPSGCKKSPKCLKKQGKCMLLKDAMNCEGIVNSQLCSGNKCACCYPKPPCKVSEKCSKVNGECIRKENWGNCDGILKKRWCNGSTCGCCYRL